MAGHSAATQTADRRGPHCSWDSTRREFRRDHILPDRCAALTWAYPHNSLALCPAPTHSTAAALLQA